MREARDRVRAALQNAQFEFPARKVTVNLAPADLPKESGRFDLPIALGILAATGQIPAPALARYEFAGELALTGELRAVRGALAMVLSARRDGRAFVLPAASAAEAALVRDADRASGARSLLAVCAHLTGRDAAAGRCAPAPPASDRARPGSRRRARPGAGQARARNRRRGSHSLLMIGPPGTGKSMLAQRLPALLPPLTEDEALEVAALASLAGPLRARATGASARFARRITRRARSALVGGGSDPRPGEISLAHHGVLFLDELPEWDRRVLEVLREPIESGVIHISRAARQATFPGAVPARRGDESLPVRLARPRERPLPLHAGPGGALSRAHLRAAARSHRPAIEVPVAAAGGVRVADGAPTAAKRRRVVRERVAIARAARSSRGRASRTRGSTSRRSSALARPMPTATRCSRSAIARLSLSARAYHRILKVARTIADLAGSASVAARMSPRRCSFGASTARRSSVESWCETAECP